MTRPQRLGDSAPAEVLVVRDDVWRIERGEQTFLVERPVTAVPRVRFDPRAP